MSCGETTANESPFSHHTSPGDHENGSDGFHSDRLLAAGFTYQHADVNGNGTITSLDALCTLRQVAALPATSACPAVVVAPTPTPTSTPVP